MSNAAHIAEREVPTKPGTDPVRGLRRGLKFLGRSCGPRAIRVEELRPDEHSLTAQAAAILAKVKRGRA